MNESHDVISAIEEALQSLQILAASQPTELHLASEVKRFEARLRQLETLAQVFVCPA